MKKAQSKGVFQKIFCEKTGKSRNYACGHRIMQCSQFVYEIEKSPIHGHS